MRYVLVACAICTAVLFQAESLAQSDYLLIHENIIQRSGHTNVRIDGKISHLDANMTVIYPDGRTEKSVLQVANNGYINGFVSLNTAAPSGLYTVEVTSDALNTLVSYFFLSEYDGLIEINIARNASISCMLSENRVAISETCIYPNKTHIPKTSGIRFFNLDYKKHQMNVGGVITDVILPRGDEIVYPEKTGNYKYHCIIHPWVGGEIGVTDVESMRFYTPLVESAINPTIQSHSAYTIMTHDASCSMCYVGRVTRIVDGDTIHVDDKPVRLSLVDTPEKGKEGFDKATTHTKNTCPVGSIILVDIDDMQPRDRFGRQIAKITCGDVNLNESLLESKNAVIHASYCMKSEFIHDDWTGCLSNDQAYNKTADIAKTIPSADMPGKKADITPAKGIGANSDVIIFIFLAVVTVLALVCVIFLKRPIALSSKRDPVNFEFLD